MSMPGVGGAGTDAKRAANPARYLLYGAAMAWGFAYPFSQIDIIPDHIPVIGYIDQIGFVALAVAAAWLAAVQMSRNGTPVQDESALLPIWAPGRAIAKRPPQRPMRWRDAQIMWLSAVRRALLQGFAYALAGPLLRLAMGRWPTGTEITAFRRGFQRFAPIPPLLRALASVPAARHQVMRTMLVSWMLADESYQGALRAELGSADPNGGDHLQVWLGPKITFLHLEKTAGMSVTSVLSSRFHPMQIDPDPRRSFPPHVLTPLPPFLIDRVKRYALVWGHYDLPSIRRLGADRFVLTVLRNPRARILSLYWYWRSTAAQDLGWAGMNQPVLAAQTLPLLEFLQSTDPAITDYIDNFYVRRLTGQYRSGSPVDPLQADPVGQLASALDGLKEFDFVGLTEDIPGLLRGLSDRLGFPLPEEAPRVNVTRPSTGAETGALTGAPDDPAVVAELDRLTNLDSIVYDAARRRATAQAAPRV